MAVGVEFKPPIASPPAAAAFAHSNGARPGPGPGLGAGPASLLYEQWLGRQRSGSFCDPALPPLRKGSRSGGGSVDGGPTVRRKPPPQVHHHQHHLQPQPLQHLHPVLCHHHHHHHQLPHHRRHLHPQPPQWQHQHHLLQPQQQLYPAGLVTPSSHPLPSFSSSSFGNHSLQVSVATGRLRPLSAAGSRLSPDGALVVRGRGLSTRPPLDSVPLPEPADEGLLHEYIAYTQNAIASYDNATGSGRSSPSNVETQSMLSLSQGGWTTGNTTERSSLDSSCYSLDEFDRQAANTVKQKFEEFESMLFEGPREANSSAYKECREWLTHFPHLRVLGSQVLAPSETGFHFVTPILSLRDISTPRPSTDNIELNLYDHDLSSTSDTQGLMLSGHRVKATPVPVVELASERNRHGDLRHVNKEFDFLHEEVFAQDGVYEDIIAVDYKSLYEENMEHKKQITPRRRRVGYPPITPNACAKDSISSGVFDSMWCEIMSWMRSIIKRYGQELESKKDAGNHALVPQQSYSRTSSFVLQTRSTLPMDSQMTFDGMLKVSSMPLQNRNASLSMAAAEGPDPGMFALSHTSLVPVHRLTSNRPSTVSRWQKNRQGRLDPLPEPSRLQSSEEGRSHQPSPQHALRVKQIVPSGPHRLSSPPNPLGGRLPPLEASTGTPSHRGKLGHRASSAIDNKEGRTLVARDRSSNAIEVNRPSTTQAFRSETPLNSRRSSTPLGQSSRLVVMSHSVGGLGIMGSSLHPSSEATPNILEDNEGPPMEDARHNHFIPSTRNFTNNFYQRMQTLRKT